MEPCKVSIYLAYAASIYIGASLYYLIRTKMFNDVGTPFNDSLTAEQRIIKETSSGIRLNIFVQGLLGTILLLIALQPFKSCV